MRGCSGTGEYEAGKEKKKSQYALYKKLDYTTVTEISLFSRDIPLSIVCSGAELCQLCS